MTLEVIAEEMAGVAETATQAGNLATAALQEAGRANENVLSIAGAQGELEKVQQDLEQQMQEVKEMVGSVGPAVVAAVAEYHTQTTKTFAPTGQVKCQLCWAEVAAKMCKGCKFVACESCVSQFQQAKCPQCRGTEAEDLTVCTGIMAEIRASKGVEETTLATFARVAAAPLTPSAKPSLLMPRRKRTRWGPRQDESNSEPPIAAAGAQASSSSTPPSWSCPKCTYINLGNQTTCEMCHDNPVTEDSWGEAVGEHIRATEEMKKQMQRDEEMARQMDTSHRNTRNRKR